MRWRQVHFPSREIASQFLSVVTGSHETWGTVLCPPRIGEQRTASVWCHVIQVDKCLHTLACNVVWSASVQARADVTARERWEWVRGGVIESWSSILLGVTCRHTLTSRGLTRDVKCVYLHSLHYLCVTHVKPRREIHVILLCAPSADDKANVLDLYVFYIRKFARNRNFFVSFPNLFYIFQ